MDAIQAQLQDLFEGQIDFDGQRLVDNLNTILLSITGILAFLIGYIQKDVYLMLWVGLAGMVLTSAVVVPPWPVYNKAPQAWLGVDGRVKSGNLMPMGFTVEGGK